MLKFHKILCGVWVSAETPGSLNDDSANSLFTFIDFSQNSATFLNTLETFDISGHVREIPINFDFKSNNNLSKVYAMQSQQAKYLSV